MRERPSHPESLCAESQLVVGTVGGDDDLTFSLC
jgi:hypothetical protein